MSAALESVKRAIVEHAAFLAALERLTAPRSGIGRTPTQAGALEIAEAEGLDLVNTYADLAERELEGSGCPTVGPSDPPPYLPADELEGTGAGELRRAALDHRGRP